MHPQPRRHFGAGPFGLRLRTLMARCMSLKDDFSSEGSERGVTREFHIFGHPKAVGLIPSLRGQFASQLGLASPTMRLVKMVVISWIVRSESRRGLSSSLRAG